jgi:hypothetical protein
LLEASSPCPEGKCYRGSLCKEGNWVLDCACCLNSDGSPGFCSPASKQCTARLTPDADTFTTNSDNITCTCPPGTACGCLKSLRAHYYSTNVARAFLRFPLIKYLPTLLSSASLSVHVSGWGGCPVPVTFSLTTGPWDEKTPRTDIVQVESDASPQETLDWGENVISLKALVESCMLRGPGCTGFQIEVAKSCLPTCPNASDGNGCAVWLSSKENQDPKYQPPTLTATWKW